MAGELRIHHIAISVADPQKSKDVYDPFFSALGGEPGMDRTDLCSWHAPGLELLAYLRERAVDHQFGEAGWQHLAVEVASRDLVDAVRSAVATSAHIVHEPREYPEYWPGYYALFFEDADGIRWEVMFGAGKGH